ncbi:MAG: hydrogenase maturation protease [Candidatus Hodarchaeales archaeon]
MIHLPQTSDSLRIINAELMPENFITPLKKWQPTHLIIIDAIQAEFEPGEICIFTKSDISMYQALSTHNLPLTFLLKQLDEIIQINFLGIGIQVQTTMFGFEELSPAVEKSINKLGKSIQEILSSLI